MYCLMDVLEYLLLPSCDQESGVLTNMSVPPVQRLKESLVNSLMGRTPTFLASRAAGADEEKQHAVTFCLLLAQVDAG